MCLSLSAKNSIFVIIGLVNNLVEGNVSYDTWEYQEIHFMVKIIVMSTVGPNNPENDKNRNVSNNLDSNIYLVISNRKRKG